jgi:hypothetical protein
MHTAKKCANLVGKRNAAFGLEPSKAGIVPHGVLPVLVAIASDTTRSEDPSSGVDDPEPIEFFTNARESFVHGV